MVGIYKLIFDLAVYYTLSGFYIHALFQAKASALGLILLCVTAALTLLLRRKHGQKNWHRWILLLPVLTLIIYPGLVSTIQFVIAWAYLVYCLIQERYYVELETFRSKFTQSCWMLLLLLPGFAFCKGAAEAFASVIAYLLLQLVSGVCCLRTLREAKSDNGRQGLIVLAITVTCGLLTLAGVPQMLSYVLKNYVWDILMQGLSLLTMVVAYGVITGLEWLVSLGQMPTSDKKGEDGASTAEILGIDEELLKSDTGEILWLEVFGYILLALLILAGIILLARFLIGNRDAGRKNAASVWSEERETLTRTRRRRSWRKPQDPRMAVRYYYVMYMRECRRRGVSLQPALTSRELADLSTDSFSGQSAHQLAEVYEPVRYCLRQPVTAQQVKQAAKLWQGLKRTKNTKTSG